MIKDV